MIGLALDPLGNVGVKTGGATGGSTIWEGMKAVASGYSDCVLVMGWERMDEVPTDEGNFLISCAADKDWESPLGHIYTGYYAVMAQRYWQIFGKSEDSFRRTLAEISVKHHGYARFNPFAQSPMKITVDDVLNSPVVAYPLRALDCCLMSVGAACAILCDEDTAVQLTKNTKNKPLRIWVAAGSHTLRPADRLDMAIPLLPNETADQYKDLGERFPGGDRYPGFTGFLAARIAAYYGYGMAGITDPTKILMWLNSMMPLPSAMSRPMKISVSAPMVMAGTMLNPATVTIPIPIPDKPGKLPSNLSGGLIGCMHSVGATGIMQTFEVATHIWNRWEEFHGDEKLWQKFNREKPSDWTNLQVKGAKRGMAISHAGVGSHVTSTILMDPDHLIK